MKHIRLLLIEDSGIFRECITAIINAEPDLRVVTGGSTNILQVTHELSPDILLIGIGVGPQDELCYVKSVNKEFRHVKVIGICLIPTRIDIREFVKAGVSGFIAKDATRKDCLQTIRAVANGTKIFPLFPTEDVNELAKEVRDSRPTTTPRVTKREGEIISLIADGLTNKEIARQLNVATHTVKTHVHNIMGKLAVHSRLKISTWVHSKQALSRTIDPFPRNEQYGSRVWH